MVYSDLFIITAALFLLCSFIGKKVQNNFLVYLIDMRLFPLFFMGLFSLITTLLMVIALMFFIIYSATLNVISLVAILTMFFSTISLFIYFMFLLNALVITC